MSRVTIGMAGVVRFPILQPIPTRRHLPNRTNPQSWGDDTLLSETRRVGNQSLDGFQVHAPRRAKAVPWFDTHSP